MSKTKTIADDFLDIMGTAATTSTIKGWLSSGVPHINKIVSGKYEGGFAYGRLYEIFGPSGSGKTLLATNAMIEAQQAGGLAILVDFEHAFDVELGKTFGLDASRLISLEPDSWEEGMMKAMQIVDRIREQKKIDENAPIIVVTDSIASAIPMSVLAKEVTEHTMNDTTALARATSNTLKIVQGRAKRTLSTWVFLNQIRLKPGVMFGDPTTTPGGNAMEFYASGRLSLSRQQITKTENKVKTVVGAHITAKCVKSKHTRPFQTAAVDFMYNADGLGGYFDLGASLIDYLLEIDVLKKEGTFIVWTDGKKYQRGSLVSKVNDEGLVPELFALLPEDIEEVPTDS